MQHDSVFIYARTSSTRLPGKALMPIGGYKLIEIVINGLKKLKESPSVILLTSVESSDDILENVAYENNIICFRGDLRDVAKRTVDAIKKYNINYFARVNGDCPVQKKELLEEGFDRIKKGEFDLVTNIFPRSFPYGISVEILKAETFIRNYNFFDDFEKENITAYFYKHSERFKISSILSDVDYFKLGYEFTVDDENGYLRMKKFLEEYPEINQQPIDEIIKLYRKKTQYD